MTRRKQRTPPRVDVLDLLNHPVTVKIDGVETAMHPFGAQIEQCANAALKGDIRSCGKFINWCLREGLIDPVVPFDDHQYIITIPKDWDDDDFHKMYDRYGPPPWAGAQDGLTSAERERRKELAKQRRRARS